MAEDFNVKASFDADVSDFISNVDKAIDSANNLKDAVGDDLRKGLERFERAASKAAQPFRGDLPDGLGKTTKAIAEQATGIQALINQYNSLKTAASAAKNAGPMAQQNPLLGQRLSALSDKGRTDFYSQMFGGQVAKDNAHIAKEKAAAQERIAVAKSTNAALIQEERSARQKELDSLRAAITERANMERAAATTRANDAAAANKRMVADEASARQRELALLKASIQERHAQQEKVSRAQLAYSKQVQRAGGTYGQDVNDDLISQRYALYDVAAAWGVVSAATLGTLAAAGRVAVEYETSFAQVQRTSQVTGDAAQALRNDLVNLTTALPADFSEVAGIAKLGGQLGIASDGIADFTQVTAQLTATTDLSAEAAGTALGRFQALLGVGSDEFENVASSILKVGINSVATESQIVNIATQISSMGDFAGLTADQVIGLSGALASVGAQPELSRGTITRTFTLMSKAVAEGGLALSQFAAVSGVSAEQFSKAWGTAEFGDVFQSFLQGIDREGENAVQTLNNLGITSVRDVPLLMRLAGAGDVVAGSFADAASGYADNSELANQYGIIAETTAAKLQMLGNTLSGIVDSLGAGSLGPFGLLLDLVQNLAEVFLAISRNPIGKFLAGLIATMAAGVGIMAAYRGAQALSLAAMLAMQRASAALTAQQAGHSSILKELIATMFRFGVGANVATAGSNAFTASLNGATGAAARASAAFKGATVAARSFGAASKTAIASTGVGLALVGVISAVEALGNAMKSSEQKAEEFFGSLNFLDEAIKLDTAVFDETDEAIYSTTIRVKENKAELSDWAQRLADASGAQIGLSDFTSSTTEVIRDQTIALGENAKAQLATELVNNEKFQAVWKENGAAIEAAGFSLETFLQKSLENPGNGSAYLNDIINQYAELEYQMSNAIAGNTLATQAQIDETNAIRDTLRALEAFRDVASATDTVISDSVAGTELMATALRAFGVEIDTAGTDSENFSNVLQDIVNAELTLIDATMGVQSSLFGLGESLHANGTSFNTYSEGGRANMEALSSTISAMVTAAAGDEAMLAASLAGLMQQLSAFGVDAVGELAFVTNMISQLTGGKGTSGLLGVQTAAWNAGQGLNQGFAAGAAKASEQAAKAGKSASKAAKEIRTLSDYVKDLAGVFADSFEFRFGLQQSVDDVADAFQKLVDYSAKAAEAVKAAQQAIREADAEIRGLSAAKGTLEYQLVVAQEYGDTLRANEILAEMAENEAKLRKAQEDRADGQKDLNKANDKATKTLNGTSEGAREQREMVLDLVESYHAQVEALANSGLSQDQIKRKTAELKREFEAQLRQLGYNTAQVAVYSRSFDDLTYAINKVPRNLTLNANADPAIRAVQEYNAHLRSAQSAATALGNTSITPTYNDANMKKMARGMAIQANIISAMHTLSTATNPSMIAALNATIKQLEAKLASGNYASGGFTGRGGKYEPAGVVHRGEYVIPKEYVNQTTGLPYANALNGITRMQTNHTNNYYNGGHVNGDSIRVVELSAIDRQLLAAAGNVTLTMNGRVVAQAVNGSNANQASRGAN